MPRNLITKLLCLLSGLAMTLAFTTYINATPANVSGFNPVGIEDNECFSGGYICPDGSGGYDFHCVTPLPNPCAVGSCYPDYFEDTVNDVLLWYCLCNGEGGSIPDPRNQAGWDCGITGKTETDYTPISANCMNDANCAASAACNIHTTPAGCKTCKCS